MVTVKVTDESFDADVLKSSTPVLVDFGADGAAPASRSARPWSRSRTNWPAR